MNAKRITFVATLLATALGGAWADDITPDPYTHMVSTRTRAEVIAERNAAIADGSIALLSAEDGGATYLARHMPRSTLTRAEVRNQVLAARKEGVLEVFNSEDAGSFFLARQQRPSRVDAHIAAVAR